MKRLKVFVMALCVCLTVPLVTLTGCGSEEGEARLPLEIYQTDELYFANGRLYCPLHIGVSCEMMFPIISNRPLESIDAIRIYNQAQQRWDADVIVSPTHIWQLGYVRLAEYRYLNNMRLLMTFRTRWVDIRRMVFDIEGQTVEFVTDFMIDLTGSEIIITNPRSFAGTISNRTLVQGDTATVMFYYQVAAPPGLVFDSVVSSLDDIVIDGVEISERGNPHVGQPHGEWRDILPSNNINMIVKQDARLRVHFDFGRMRERSIFFGHNFVIKVRRIIEEWVLYASASNGMSGIQFLFEEIASNREWVL